MPIVPLADFEGMIGKKRKGRNKIHNSRRNTCCSVLLSQFVQKAGHTILSIWSTSARSVIAYDYKGNSTLVGALVRQKFLTRDDPFLI